MKLKTTTLLLFLASVLFTSCGTTKVNHLLKKGHLEQENFKVLIPFEYRLGLIVLKVQVNGIDYHFLLDTGAPNLISKTAAEELELKAIVSQNIGDSQGGHSNLDFVKLDVISIGGLNFRNTGAVVADLGPPNEMSCLGVDGFIVSNLMKQAIWEFDFEKQEICITNTLDSLNIPEGNQNIKFNTAFASKPYIDIKLGEEEIKHVLIDLGSNQGFNLSQRLFRKLKKNGNLSNTTTGFGSASAGLYGRGKNDSTFFAILPSITLGNEIMENQIVNFKSDNKRIGTAYFKNYRTIFNWFTGELSLIKTLEYDNSKIELFGFNPIYRENKLFVGYLYSGSDAILKGLQLGDQILQINEIDYQDILINNYCEIKRNGFVKDLNEIKIIVLREGEKLSFDLKKTIFLKNRQDLLI